ncbi:galactose-3-O-sulfotransferase 2-like [Haliotis rufescens]|uniref:galactose-3-O-sulfotransferase 2-like n=1 Tax=Haliotis rufescens TaxID=6454 RepID=UPI00201F64FF|nr:galactose-3-O-sulfotransferase 2-like [Haliotis rufescens]
MAKLCKISSMISKRAMIRLVCFGAVAYVSVLAVFQWPRQPVMTNVIQRMCERSPAFRPTCSCQERKMTLPRPSPQPSVIHTANQTKRLPEKQHVAFVKTHKAASSTVLNILYRFASERGLVIILPKVGNYLTGRYLNKTRIFPPPKGKKFDILCNHALFNYTSFSSYLPTDTEYIGIVREPFQRFVSAVHYFRFTQPKEYLQRIPGRRGAILKTYLENPMAWEPENPMQSMTNNRMAIDFGFPAQLLRNESLFDEYLISLNKTFRVVMIAEQFDESLVLVKRTLNWSLKDVIYTIKNRARFKIRVPGIEGKLMMNFYQVSNLDKKLYDFSLKRFRKQIEQEGPDFHKEVEYFRTLRENVASFCTRWQRKPKLEIPPSNWSRGFSVTRRECTLLRLEELPFVSYLQNQRKNDLLGFGANNDFMKSIPL